LLGRYVPKMDFKSEYFNFSFSEALTFRRVITWVVSFLCTFALVAVFNFDRSETRSRGLLTKVIYGLSHISVTGLIITLIVGLILATLIVYIINLNYNDRPIVICLNFDDDKEQLKIRTKTLSDKVNDLEVSYSSLKVIAKRMSDGIDAPTDGLIIYNNNSVLGYYIGNHWTSQDSNNLEEKINKVLKRGR
jgi:hypothetical protein